MTDQYRADVTMLSPNDSGRRTSPPSIIVIHTNEGPGDAPIENLLGWLQQPRAQASYTMVVGRDGRTGRCNDDDYIPWAAGSPANDRGLHLCLTGYARQTTAEWLAQTKQLDAAARVVADWCRRYGIPATWLTGDRMRAGAKGIGGHDTTVAAWHATDHTDPGAGFPRAQFIQMVNRHLTAPKEEDTMTEDDRRMLREIHDQLLGPAGKGWPQLGKNAKGQNLTLVDGVAALRADVDALAEGAK